MRRTWRRTRLRRLSACARPGSLDGLHHQWCGDRVDVLAMGLGASLDSTCADHDVDDENLVQRPRASTGSGAGVSSLAKSLAASTVT